MRSSALTHLLRAVLLLGLLAFFCWSLISSLLAERHGAGADPSGRLGADPGLRVLLSQDDAGEQRFTSLNLLILHDALLYNPDDPFAVDQQLRLQRNQRVELRPDVGGIAVLTGGDSPIWPIQRLALRPLQVSNAFPSDGPPPDLAGFEAADHGPVWGLNGRRYRGNLEIVRSGPTQLKAVNALPIEAYVEGVVQAEMREYWPLEALKAQAIAARSFAHARRWRHERSDGGLLHYDLTDSGLDPVYRGTGNSGQKISWAVNDTRGRVLTWMGKPFEAWFHASSGGYTENITAIDPEARSVDGEVSLADVMPAQPDPYCSEGVEALDKRDSHWLSSVTISTAQLRQLLIEQERENHWVYDMEVRRHAGGRVRAVQLKILPDQELVLSGHQFRQMIGPQDLRSTLWSPESPVKLPGEGDRRGGYRISCYGWGHGVGMSQVSAYAMARRDRSAQEILALFYVGAQIEQIWY